MAEVKNAKKAGAPRKRKELKKVDKGQVHIQSTFNNTLVTITDMSGNAISWSSAGSLGYKGSRRVRRSRRRWLRKRRRKRRKSTGFAALKCM